MLSFNCLLVVVVVVDDDDDDDEGEDTDVPEIKLHESRKAVDRFRNFS